ncbi:MAG: hypothetical protein QM785_09535 [Pyrinomonadaceae bacterium]
MVAQTKFEPAPENIKAVNRPDSPVQITIDGVYPSASDFRFFGYTLRNASDKEVRALNVRTMRDGVASSFSLGLPGTMANQLGFESGLKGGSSKVLSLPVDGYDRKPAGWTLSIDFVLFRDGTRWGPDEADYGDWLTGVFDGQARFIYEVKKAIAAQDEQILTELIMRDGPPIGIPVNANDRQKTQTGIGAGYNVTRLMFRSDLLGRGDLTGVPARIRDIERSVKGASAGDDGRRQFTVQYGFGAPLKFLDVANGEQKIAFDERFRADGDWLTGHGIRMKNESGKTIKFVSLGVTFPETLNSGSTVSAGLRYGPHPITQAENEKQPRIAPGQSFEIIIDEERPGGLMKALSKSQDHKTISRAVIELNYIDFEDGTRWGGGQWQKQDPDNPKRWIPVKP